ncbi:MAG TPA: Ppx/GppA phosphatase family protein [Caulobacteraceae bacterium]|jgi:exopolyphosphatase/guanosine-5'-triphosphate,3'-diphosphate pyrophosphatase|nr:Ppx/GppA phosphatase family protein [Caulobacteraceae bacterium]
MAEALVAPPDRSEGSRRGAREPTHFAALDLGTNNCRLLVASPTQNGFRIVDAYSRIVRLGEGLSLSGRLSDAAMERALAALRVCADKVRRYEPVKLRAIATQACRAAENGAEFLARVQERTGIVLDIITPREEAQLSVAGCSNLIDHTADAALVLDVGGGSTELAWVDLRERRGARGTPPITAWLSVPIGVVTLAERFPEAEAVGDSHFSTMVAAVRDPIAAFAAAEPLRELFDAGRSHLIGTSGAITSLAGLHLQLPRYDRSKVDGLWMTRGQCEAVRMRLAALTTRERAAQPCIGPDRADLVLAGAAILEAVQEVWPCERVRVADRGLREGVLLSLMGERRGRRRRRRRSR